MHTYPHAAYREGKKGKERNNGLGPGGEKQIKFRKTDSTLSHPDSIQRELTPANFRHQNRNS